MEKQLKIEWRHLDKNGKTCDRCADTGEAVRGACRFLTKELSAVGWTVTLKETLLTDRQIPESNAILINGIPLERLLPDARKSENCCVSCGEILGAPTRCRTIECQGRTYEAIPAELILKAVYRFIQTQKE